MLLAVETAAGFINFIQILCWIALPVLLSAVLVTVLLHYRRRRKEAGKPGEEDNKLLYASPEKVGYTRGDGEYVLFDHSPLITEYKNRLFYNHARYTVLRKDFAALEKKYSELNRSARTQFSNPQNNIMENANGQVPQHTTTEMDKLLQDHAAEKKELQDRLEQINRSYQSLEQENSSLLEQLSMDAAGDGESNNLVKRWKEENALLKEKVAEQEYLKDILEEKKAQINFLQAQVEERVKGQHQAELKRQQAMAEMENMKKEHRETESRIESLKNELLLKQEETDKIQVVLCGREEELAEKQQALYAKQDHIFYLENTLTGTKEQNELLNAELADTKDIVHLLQRQLEDEQSRVRLMEEKLQTQKQMMRRLYREFSSFMAESHEMPPVVALRPEYGSPDNEEMAAQ